MLETITKKVVSYCEIPEKLTESSWLSEKEMDSYIECHLDNSQPLEPLDEWFLENYAWVTLWIQQKITRPKKRCTQ